MNLCSNGAITRTGGAPLRIGGAAGAKYSVINYILYCIRISIVVFFRIRGKIYTCHLLITSLMSLINSFLFIIFFSNLLTNVFISQII